MATAVVTAPRAVAPTPTRWATLPQPERRPTDLSLAEVRPAEPVGAVRRRRRGNPGAGDDAESARAALQQSLDRRW